MCAGRRYSFADRVVGQLDRGLRTVFGGVGQPSRPNPSSALGETVLSDTERKHSAGLLRVDHAGEVAAQALYQGQALTARDERIRRMLEVAAEEENDHLAWCEQRLDELGAGTSVLNPLWYGGSFAIGAVAGFLGDRWSLGFLAETERQVVSHIESHLDALPKADDKSRAILEQMREDEGAHATSAVDAGGAELTPPVKRLMGLMSRVMTRTAYWV